MIKKLWNKWFGKEEVEIPNFLGEQLEEDMGNTLQIAMRRVDSMELANAANPVPDAEDILNTNEHSVHNVLASNKRAISSVEMELEYWSQVTKLSARMTDELTKVKLAHQAVVGALEPEDK